MQNYNCHVRNKLKTTNIDDLVQDCGDTDALH